MSTACLSDSILTIEDTIARLWRLRYLLITNMGASPARNIRIEYDEDEGLPLLEKETLTAMLPYKADLHPGGSIRMSAVEVDSKTGHSLTFVWDDDFATGRRETLAVRTGM